MGRIIKNLRAFARQEVEPVADVDLIAAIEAALDPGRARIEATGTTVLWSPPGAKVWVCGGEVRLQQMVMNLIVNACDAMAGRARREIFLAVVRTAGRVRLRLADTGPGIAEPERIFDLFYSTKEVGHSEGMGLGLSISYGLIKSFGGEISGRNRDEGGAEFTIDLMPAAARRAACAAGSCWSMTTARCGHRWRRSPPVSSRPRTT